MKTRTFFILVSIAFFSALACCGNHSFDESSSVINLIDQTNPSGNPYEFITKDGSTISVFYMFPAAIDNNTRIFFAMHGSGREANLMLNTFMPMVEEENIILIVPEFTAKQFNSLMYEFIGIDGNIVMPENWTSKIIDSIFLDFKKRFDLLNDRYIMYGISGGAQFTHRAVMYSESDYLDYAIAANAGAYTFPDYQVNHPYGIKNTFPLYGDLIHRNYGRRLYIQIGDQDADVNDPSLPAVDGQGPHRYMRALTFFEASRNYCELHNLFFNWELREISGVGHAPSMFHVQNILKENRNVHYDIPSVMH